MKVSYQSIAFFNKLLEYTQNCKLDDIEDRSKNDYISFFVKVRNSKNEEQDITITVENNKESNIEVLFLKTTGVTDRLLVVHPFSKSFVIVQDIISICSERTMSSWMKENKVLNIL